MFGDTSRIVSRIAPKECSRVIPPKTPKIPHSIPCGYGIKGAEVYETDVFQARPPRRRCGVPLLSVGLQHTGKLLVHRLACGKLNTQEDHAGTASPDTHQPTKVPVSGHADPCLCARSGEQSLIYCPRIADVRRRERLMPCIPKKPRCDPVDVLLQKPSHACAVIWRSSAAMTSIA
jgi:hypothetical protein